MINQTFEQQFKLDNFEGPLDLLLHIIREKKLDILEVNLVQIADQYIKYIDQARKINLDIASEYLLIASQLIEIKSRHLMKSEIFTGPPEEYEEDHEELLMKLMEYEKYKNISEKLIDIYEENPLLDKEDDEFAEYMEDEADVVIQIMTKGKSELIEAYYNIRNRFLDQNPLETKIINTRISPEERRGQIRKFISENGDTTFSSLINVADRYYIAVSLLVVLEMANNSEIKLKQVDEMQDIQILVNKDGN